MNKFSFDPFPELETERLFLQELKPEHADVMFRLRSNDEVNRFIMRPKAKEVSEALKWIEKVRAGFSNGANITWTIVLKKDGIEVGSILLWNFTSENYRGEIGYELLPAYHRQGIMSEAVDAVLQFGFDVLNLHTIEANLAPKNEASSTLLMKKGFVQEASFKEIDFYNGKFLDKDVYTCFKSSRN